MNIPPEVISLIGTLVLGVWGWINSRKTDRLGQQVETARTKVEHVETKATENKTVLDSNSATLIDLVGRQTAIQAASVELQSAMMEAQRSNEAKQAAERQTWQASVDRMAVAGEAMVAAVTANNALATAAGSTLSTLPKTIEDTKAQGVKEVNDHMDINDEEIKKRLDAIGRDIRELRELIEAHSTAPKPEPEAPSAAPEDTPEPSANPTALPVGS